MSVDRFSTSRTRPERSASSVVRPLSRRQLLKATAAAVPSLLAFTAARAAPAGTDPPDIVLVVLDALRAATLPMYGHPRDTAPFLGILARRSMVFKHCYTTALWTRPAVNGLLTGLWPIEHGQWRFGKRLPGDLPTFPRALSRAGYRTAFFTANSAVGEKYGLEAHFDHVSDRAAVEREYGSWLGHECEEWARAQPADPLFCWVHYLPPHGPYDPPTRFLDEMLAQGPASADFLPAHFRDVDVSLESAVFGRIPWYQAKVSFSTDPRHYLLRYEANVRWADALARDLFTRWEGLGRGRRTIFVVTSDHGECMGEHGLFFAHGRLLHDSILHVPLLVHDSADPTARVVEEPVSHVDLTATVLDWAGATERLGRGVSLAGGAPRGDERAVVGQDFAKSGESGWALTRGRWRLVYNDCPRWGNAHLLDVRSGVRDRSSLARVPLPPPVTALAEPVELADGVVLEELAVHATHVAAASQPPFSGRLRSAPGRGGVLEVRARVASADADPPTTVLRRACGDGDVTLAGTWAAPDVPPGEPAEVVWEARFAAAAAAADPSGGPWLRLLSYPVTRAAELAPGLSLAGAAIEPAAARPGERVAVRSAWRLTRRLPADTAVRIELVAPDGSRLAPSARARLRGGEEVAVLAEAARLDTKRGIRLVDTTWLTVPTRAAPGRYRVVAVLAPRQRARLAAGAGGLREEDLADAAAAQPPAGERTAATAPSPAEGGAAAGGAPSPSAAPSSAAAPSSSAGSSPTAGPAAAASPAPAGESAPDDVAEVALAPLEVVASADRAIVRLVERDVGFAHFRALASLGEAPDEAVRASVRTLAERFPNEGHLLFLLAAGAATADERRALLRGCLERVPYHRAALAALARETLDDRARAAVAAITPPRPLDYRFDERVRLNGVDLRRAPADDGGLYLSLYWEAIAPVGDTLEAFLQYRSTSAGRSHTGRLSYLLGQAVRPCHAWRVGECVVDVLHLPLPAGRERVAVDLTLRPGWRYRDDEDEPEVWMARHPSGATRTRVLVVSARLADLPRASQDLLHAKRRNPIHYRLYDVVADPSESRDLVDERPEVFAELHEILLPLLEGEWSALAEGPAADVTPDTLERLRALGYAE